MSRVKATGFVLMSLGVPKPLDSHEFVLNLLKWFQKQGFKLQYDKATSPEEITKESYLKFSGDKPWPNAHWSCNLDPDLLDQKSILVSLTISVWGKEDQISVRINVGTLPSANVPLKSLDPLADEISQLGLLLHDYIDAQITFILPNTSTKIHEPFNVNNSDFVKAWQYVYKSELSERYEIDKSITIPTKDGNLMHKSPQSFSDYATAR